MHSKPLDYLKKKFCKEYIIKGKGKDIPVTSHGGP
jgi:hypothetical protein